MILHRADFNVSTSEKVEDVKRGEDGIFTVVTGTNQYRARAVILALGRAGEPRKLGIKGEDLPKVMYRLIEADHYINKKILVMGEIRVANRAATVLCLAWAQLWARFGVALQASGCPGAAQLA